MSARRKLPGKLAQPVVRPSAKNITKQHLNDSHSIVSTADQTLDAEPTVPATIEISSGAESSEEDEDDDDDDEDSAGVRGGALTTTGDTNMTDIPIDQEDQNAEPSFGDLIRNTLTEPIDVSAPFAPMPSHTPNSMFAGSSATSLGTVLTQALKTNDSVLLETCLQTTDLPTIRTTIQRLSSPLASQLLSVLAARLHRRPGRAGSLIVWVQWTLVSHGGYLATQKDLMKQLASLNRVIDERARGLQGLLQLKGKLDMLEAQGQLRRAMKGRNTTAGSDGEDDDEGVIYVEGQPSSEGEADGAEALQNGSAKRRKLLQSQDADEDDDDEEMPNTNGAVLVNSEDEDHSNESLIDDEAVETDDESGDEEEVDYDDEDELDSGDESEDTGPARSAPALKMSKARGLFSKT